ncbi:MAG: hypothetical protein AAGJ83_03395, partial [Planctomycetota bacterium]
SEIGLAQLSPPSVSASTVAVSGTTPGDRGPAGWIAINLCDAFESDTLLPVPDVEASEIAFTGGSSPWFYLVMFALCLIVAEWALFQRRVVE